MFEILVVNNDLEKELREDFENIFKNNSIIESKLIFIYNINSLICKLDFRKKTKTLDDLFIFHFGSSDDALIVSKLREFNNGFYKPIMITTATSNNLKKNEILYSTSLITKKFINNFYLSKLFEKDIPNVKTYFLSKSSTENSDNLLSELARTIDNDLVLTKKKPDMKNENVISNLPELSTNWILTNEALFQLNFNKDYDVILSKTNKNIIILLKDQEYFLTTYRFLEAAGLLVSYDIDNKKTEIAKDYKTKVELQTKQLFATTKQLVKNYISVE